eukprot:TRINITY_DN15778_c0_g1_i1.p1 TRINITY_DN15778_c0_g1~~TRINITY_DN15778_c0_g1_i1.p1  ORF type:complete len:439 (-),score=52.39 TRINITY_DN15778_c0_g1_i1:46-1362(-)
MNGGSSTMRGTKGTVVIGGPSKSTLGNSSAAMKLILDNAKQVEKPPPNPIKKEGWMEKRGHKRKNWTKRWFVLKKNCIEYYKSTTTKIPQGIIILDGAKISKDVGEKNLKEIRSERKDENCFLIRTRTGIDYLCRGYTDKDMSEWMLAIRIRLMELDGQIIKPPDRALSSLVEECSAAVSDYRKSFRERPKGVDEYDGNKLFGVNLDVYMFSRSSSIDCPAIITSAVENIYATGLREEGIFRLSASAEEIARLKEAYDLGHYISHKNLSPHTSACLLKLYFRELPDPLLTFKLYPRWLRILLFKDEASKLEKVRELISALPVLNRNIASIVFKLMYAIAQNVAENKMTSVNLSVTVAQTLMRPRSDDPTVGLVDAGKVGELVKWMIDSYKDIWETKRIPPPVPTRAGRGGLTITSQQSAERTGNLSKSMGSLILTQQV